MPDPSFPTVFVEVTVFLILVVSFGLLILVDMPPKNADKSNLSND